MASEEVNVSVTDGALALAGVNPDELVAKIGVSSLGTANTVYVIADPKNAAATLGHGPLAESVAAHLTPAGGPILAVPVAASNVGTVGAITRVGTSPSPGLGTTGTPRDKYDVIARIVAGGTVGNATFQISWDNGLNWSPVYATAASIASFVTFSGLTLTFAAGTYVPGDTYTFATVAPTYSASDLNAALDALKAYAKSPSGLHVVGTVGGVDDATKITNFCALAAAVQTKLDGWEQGKRWVYAALELPDLALETAWGASATFAALVAPRITPAGGRVTVTSEISNRQVSLSLGVAYLARLASIPPQEHPGKYERGPLKNVLAISHDERSSPTFNGSRITSSWTYPDVGGFFIKGGKMLCASGSDFDEIQRRRVIDKACRVTYLALLQYHNDDITVDATTGFILETEALAIEKQIEGKLETALIDTNNASAVAVTVNRTTNILSTEELLVSVRVIPKGYLKTISADVGLLNPVLQAV